MVGLLFGEKDLNWPDVMPFIGSLLEYPGCALSVVDITRGRFGGKWGGKVCGEVIVAASLTAKTAIWCGKLALDNSGPVLFVNRYGLDT